MKNKNEAYNHPEYWMEKIQNQLYREISVYLKNNDMTQSDFADKLGCTKGYVSQVLSGNFRQSLFKMIELSIAIGKFPVIHFVNNEEYGAKRKNYLIIAYNSKQSFDIKNQKEIAGVFNHYIQATSSRNEDQVWQRVNTNEDLYYCKPFGNRSMGFRPSNKQKNL